VQRRSLAAKIARRGAAGRASGVRPLARSGLPVTIPANPLGALRYRGARNDDDFFRVPPAAQTCIRKQETCSRQLCERITQREEQFCLAQRRRFPQSRDKFKDRVFVEAEHITGIEPDDVDAGACDKACVLPLMRGCP